MIEIVGDIGYFTGLLLIFLFFSYMIYKSNKKED